MAIIALEGMKFRAFHGMYAAERILGSDFILDVFVQAHTDVAAAADDVAATVNYETLFQICRMEMGEPRNLIETLVEGIIQGIQYQFPSIQAMWVRVKKCHPPLGGRVAASSVQAGRSFVRSGPAFLPTQLAKSFISPTYQNNMAIIALEGMRFRAFHGVYEPERILGSDFIVDVFVLTDTSLATSLDDVAATVNYETIFQICRMEMEEPRNLIETVVEGIIVQMKHQFSSIQSIRVKLQKCHPPLGGVVGASSIEEEQSFVSECARCGKGFVCYGDDVCWCQSANLHLATKEMIKRQYRGCICQQCTKFFVG